MALSNRDCLPPVDFMADGLRTAASKQQKRVNFGGNWTDGKRHKQTGNPLRLECDAADKHPSKADKEQKIHSSFTKQTRNSSNYLFEQPALSFMILSYINQKWLYRCGPTRVFNTSGSSPSLVHFRS